jgi:hypothetical protein
MTSLVCLQGKTKKVATIEEINDAAARGWEGKEEQAPKARRRLISLLHEAARIFLGGSADG